jgi:hypothetical protein
MDKTTNHELPKYIDGLPNVCGSEDLVRQAMTRSEPIYLPESGIEFGRIRSAFIVALHMHQPLIRAGGGELQKPAVISNLKYMMDNQHIGDNHNAPTLEHGFEEPVAMDALHVIKSGIPLDRNSESLGLEGADGWWPEGYSESNGWLIDAPAEAGAAAQTEALYHLLEEQIMPAFFASLTRRSAAALDRDGQGSQSYRGTALQCPENGERITERAYVPVANWVLSLPPG